MVLYVPLLVDIGNTIISFDCIAEYCLKTLAFFICIYNYCKKHIYVCKFQMLEPKLEGFVKMIENLYNIEKYIAIKNIFKKHIFKQKWFIENADDDPEI